MTASKPGFRLGLQGKVLIAVVSFSVIVPLLSFWIVTGRMRNQMEADAERSVATAQTLFNRMLASRSKILITRFRTLADEARIRVGATMDPQQAPQLLEGVKEGAPPEEEGFALLDLDGRHVAAVAKSGSTVDLPKLEEIGRAGLADRERAATVELGGRAYTVVSVPVFDPRPEFSHVIVGSLVSAVSFTDANLDEFQAPSTITLLVSNGQVIAAGRGGRDLPADVARTLAQSVPEKAEPREIAESNYMVQGGAVSGGGVGAHPVYAIILSSYQNQLVALQDTQRQLLELSVFGIVICALVVSWLVRRLTQPLRELVTSAEAVGRGDFSQRIGRVSADECGDLAVAFNQMIANLHASRAELEKAVETLRNTQSQLIQSEKLSAVGQFVAGVAHELNNPLTAVIGFSDLLSQTASDPKIRPHLDLIAKSAHRCHKIVESLLSFARQHPPERKLIRVSDTIDEVLEIMAYDFRTTNITVERAYQADLPLIMADPHQLQQVFVNILGNARQAIQPVRTEGRIIITLKADGPVVRLTFADNGPGIRPEHLSRIFDPFFTTKPVGKGTGLGMSLSYGIVHEHGGTISVASEPGQGATFTIELPVAVEGKGRLSEVAAIRSGASRPPIPGRTVLVVDDEEWILALSQAVLEQEGYVVATAESGEAAIELLKDRRFDVIVSDWKMPGMNGIQLYEYLTAQNIVAASRMLFMTGDVINDTFQEFLRRQSKACLSKPFAIGEFRSAVATMAAAASA